MGTRQTDLADQYADLKRLRREVYLLEMAAQSSRAKRARLASNKQLSLKLNGRTNAPVQRPSPQLL